jgi:alpha-amylase/alpha-mannosidase (GH57 family)
MNKNNRTPIILHGHFYQPPRENPLTGIIPKQLSAEPYLDWNERILNSCYAANINARYLDGSGQVISITNNFEHISFNFGPTLLSWMEENHKDIHDQIIEADKRSFQKLGHGNAIAQGFNHTILPLDNLDDARIQIRWGIQDFQSRFERMPEGMWLPETAINPNVIDLLSEEGIKFVILSPWQCKAVEDENGNTIDLNGKPAPYDRAYILTGTNGKTISAFFYHPHLAENISFGHLLRDADAFYSHFVNLKNNEQPKLIHTATDGEIYGHHEPFGDMALAAMIKKVESREEFELTNYGKFLEDHPARLHATLHKGEDERGTSWSCFHGVSRWYKDCGCSTGGPEGWNQKWRTPLRDALNRNSDRLTKIFNDRLNDIFKGKIEPYQLLTDYGIVASERMSMRGFIKSLIEKYPIAKGNESEIACLLDGMKNKYFSFTSCGWFFNDLAGIEPKQNIQYALYAINLFQKYSSTSLLSPFLKDLQLAKSNDLNEGNGLTIAQKILELTPGEVEAAIYFVMNRTFAKDKFYTNHYGRFELLSFENLEENPKLKIYDTLSLRSFSFEGIYDLNDEGNDLKISMTVKDDRDNNVRNYNLTNSDINPRILDSAFYWIEYSLSFVDDESIRQISKDIRNYSFLYNSSPYLPLDTNSIEIIGTVLRALRSLFITPDTLTWKEKEPSVYSLVSFIQTHGRMSEKDKLKKIFREETDDLAEKVIEEGLNNDLIIEISQFLKFTYKVKLIIDLRNLQNIIYPYIEDKESCKNLDMKKFNNMKSLLNFV